MHQRRVGGKALFRRGDPEDAAAVRDVEPAGNVGPAVLALRDLLAAPCVEARPSHQIKRPQDRCWKLVPLAASLLTSAFWSRALR